MSSMQVVFLFDLNACADFLLIPKEELSKKLLSLRLACLRLLSFFSTNCPSFKWGMKFFDSHGSKNQIMWKFAFSDLSLDSFETLESEICIRYERHLSMLEALSESSPNSESSIKEKSEEDINSVFPLKVLHLAFTQVLCEFQWETMDMWSPSYTKIRNRKRNFLFLFSDFKDSDDFFFKYFGLSNSISKPKFTNLFLPQSLRESIIKKADIHLVLLNTNQNQKFMGPFSSKMLTVLSESLQSLHGSFIPLCLLSQPLYDMKLLNGKTILQHKESVKPHLPTGYQNSFIPFSTLFEQSLYHPFYSAVETSVYKCFINFASKMLEIPIQIMEISNIKSNKNEDANMKVTNPSKEKCSENCKYVWSRFNVHYAIPRSTHYPADKFFLCLPSYSKSSETCSLQRLNKNLSVEGLNLLLECVTKDGLKMLGFLMPLSSDTALVSIFNPAVNFFEFGTGYKIKGSSKHEDLENDSNTEMKTDAKSDDCEKKIHNTNLKPFQMDCLETKFKPRNLLSVSSFIESKPSNSASKMKGYLQLLKQSVTNNKSSKSKYLKQHLTYESNPVDQSEVIEEQLPENQSECEMKDLEELPSDLSHEDMLSAIRDTYNSAIEPCGNIISAAKRIMKMMISYCKKKETFFEEDVNIMFKENFLMTDRKINEKYKIYNSEDATENKIKECQIQILLILEVESLRLNPDKENCVNIITSLLRIATFCYSQKELLQLDGEKELKAFMDDVLKKNYSHSLNDILVEIGDEVFDDCESTDSPAETVSSEFNNDDELFSSVVSSTLSEKSSSSGGSQRDSKDVKEKNALEKKLLRRRSDISDTARYRQVVLPKASPKMKKSKVAVNKAIRYSPRLAAKRNDKTIKSAAEKSNKVRRNLFTGGKFCCTPKKNHGEPSTPKSKKKNYISKTKLAAETPSHKQNYSALQRRKSFIDQLSKSPKVIAESPKIKKTATDGVNKELLEKLQKASQNTAKSTNSVVEHKPKTFSFKDYTPESKRRLSLKLFSKLLSSPTARQGIKKCTKRLFDQTSPQKTTESNKRHKPGGQYEELSVTKSETPS